MLDDELSMAPQSGGGSGNDTRNKNKGRHAVVVGGKVKNMKRMKRNFHVSKGELSREEMLAVSDIVNRILTEVEVHPELKIDQILRAMDCPEVFKKFSADNEAELNPIAHNGNAALMCGFELVVHFVEDGWEDSENPPLVDQTWCWVKVPALLEEARKRRHAVC